MLFIPTVTRWDLSVCPNFGVKEVFSGLVQMIEFGYYVYVEWDKSRLRRLQRDLEKWFSCLFFYAFFLPEKESVGKKSRHKGDCAAIRYAPIRRSFPLMYPPLDCSADSDLARYRPKCSADITPHISYRGNARITLQFSLIAEHVHPMLGEIHNSIVFLLRLFVHPTLELS